MQRGKQILSKMRPQLLSRRWFCSCFFPGGSKRKEKKEEEFQSHVEAGQKYLQDENYEEAVNEFTAALDVEENVETYQMLADAYLGMGNEDAAEETETEAEATADWKQLYIDYINELPEKYSNYT
ncbi:MAG: hypothetical protein LUC83_10315, partial [Clostridiales bacterium]|nr:hypothetical protein [Clostridiales bacterium]